MRMPLARRTEGLLRASAAFSITAGVALTAGARTSATAALGLLRGTLASYWSSCWEVSPVVADRASATARGRHSGASGELATTVTAAEIQNPAHQ